MRHHARLYVCNCDAMPVGALIIAGHYAFALLACIIVTISDCADKR